MMDQRKKALEELKRQMQAARLKIDPAMLARVSRIVTTAQDKKNLVPYDKKAAAEAVRLFLSNHADGQAFKAKLIDYFSKK